MLKLNYLSAQQKKINASQTMDGTPWSEGQGESAVWPTPLCGLGENDAICAPINSILEVGGVGSCDPDLRQLGKE